MRGLKRRLLDFVQWHILNQVKKLTNEQIFQQIFAQQCLNWNIRNDFYPLGGAVGYSLLYFVARLLTENHVESIVELYHRRISTNLNLAPEPEGDQVSQKTGLIRRVGKTLGWYRDGNGREELRKIPLDDQ